MSKEQKTKSRGGGFLDFFSNIVSGNREQEKLNEKMKDNEDNLVKLTDMIKKEEEKKKELEEKKKRIRRKIKNTRSKKNY